jgi:Ca2+-binding EF-hand superfamily protein
MKRMILPLVAAAFAISAPLGAGVVKTKTKSNQSNDRCAGACPLTRGEAEAALGETFAKLDADGNGALGEAEEAGVAMERTNDGAARSVVIRFIVLPRQELRLVFAPNLDGDNDGRITRTEWLANGLSAFDKADGDHDGSMSATELRGASWDIKSSQMR